MSSGQSDHLARFFLLPVSLSCMVGVLGSSAIAQSSAARGPKLPDEVERIWRWFPADTETMIVARDVTWKSLAGEPSTPSQPMTDDERHVAQQQAFVAFARQIALGRLLTLGGGNMLQPGKYLSRLKGRSAPLVVYGGRDYEIVSAFGSYRYHGASVVVFADGAKDDLDQLLAALAAAAAEVRRLGDREVFVFPADKDEMESIYQLQPWQGTYVTRIEPNVLLCATSDVYLQEMLGRMAELPRDRALPTNLPEWKYVDATASAWGLRRIPPVDGQQLAGIVWLMQPGGRPTFEAFYFPAAGGNVERPSQVWFMERREGELAMNPELQDCIQVLLDGVTQATIRLDDIGRRVDLPFFQLYGLQGLPGVW